MANLRSIVGIEGTVKKSGTTLGTHLDVGSSPFHFIMSVQDRC